MSDTKQSIIDKLDRLEEVINKNHENGEDLFPKHWLILLQVKNEVNESADGDVPRKSLEKMNKIWKINKSIEKSGSADKFKIEVWEKIDEFCPELLTGKGFNDMPKAIRLFQASFVKDEGNEYSISEAKNLIEAHVKEVNG